MRQNRMPKADYFRMRMEEAKKNGLTEKAEYFRSRLEHMGELTKKKTTKKADKPRTSEERIQGAVRVLNNLGGYTVQQAQYYLSTKGVTDSEFLEALNIASSGEVLRSAFLD